MSPRNLVLLAAAVALVGFLGATVLWVTFRRPADPASPLPTTVAASSASYNPSASDAAGAESPDQSDGAIWPVVDRFATGFTDTNGGAAAWRARLVGNPAAPDITAEIAAQLKTVDVGRVPAGHYTGHRQVLGRSAYNISVRITYREGWGLTLNLITDGTRWQIYAYDKTT